MPVLGNTPQCPLLSICPGSEVTFNEDYKRFLQAGACQASLPGTRSTVVALLMNPAARGRNIYVHFFTFAFARNAGSGSEHSGLSVAPGQLEQQVSRASTR